MLRILRYPKILVYAAPSTGRRSISKKAHETIILVHKNNKFHNIVRDDVFTRSRFPRTSSPILFRCKTTEANNDGDHHTGWIPPDRDLIGDQGQTSMDVNDDEEEELLLMMMEEEMQKVQEDGNARNSSDSQDGEVDWLKSRRDLLKNADQVWPTAMGKMEDGRSQYQRVSDVEVKLHTLLSKHEILSVVESLGGYDLKVILDDPRNRRMGGSIGIILASGSTNFQIRSIAEALVRQLKRRKLQKFGVVGAEYGYEGSDDSQEGWYVVDCKNYVVHVQDELTRKLIDIEGHWERLLTEKSFNGVINEDEMDEWVAKNPVPDGLTRITSDFDRQLKALKTTRFAFSQTQKRRKRR